MISLQTLQWEGSAFMSHKVHSGPVTHISIPDVQPEKALVSLLMQ